jgi:hypothetical protein
VHLAQEGGEGDPRHIGGRQNRIYAAHRAQCRLIFVRPFPDWPSWPGVDAKGVKHRLTVEAAAKCTLLNAGAVVRAELVRGLAIHINLNPLPLWREEVCRFAIPVKGFCCVAKTPVFEQIAESQKKSLNHAFLCCKTMLQLLRCNYRIAKQLENEEDDISLALYS